MAKLMRVRAKCAAKPRKVMKKMKAKARPKVRKFEEAKKRGKKYKLPEISDDAVEGVWNAYIAEIQECFASILLCSWWYFMSKHSSW